MTTKEIISVMIIYLVIPLAGLFTYLRLIKQVKQENIPNPPTIDLFIVFATYGGLLLIILTLFFWQWSGMASIGTFFVLIPGPFYMGLTALKYYKNRKLSKYHLWTYRAGLLYFAIMPLSMLGLYFA